MAAEFVAALQGPPSDRRVWLATFSGLCASLVGIGMARFAYTPLLPALIAAGWFSPGQAAYLGAANLAGYLGGALSARPLGRVVPAHWLLRGMMLLSAATFFGSAVPLSFAWFFAWRFAAGYTGGVLMVLTAPTILPFVPARYRGLAGGAIFTGVGLGIAASGTLLPLLLSGGVQRAWLGLGAVALLLTAASWFGWPKAARQAARAAPRARPTRELRLVILLYGMNAVGLIPHMVFLVDYVARGLHHGMAAGAACWVAFGLGAAAGPVLAGLAGDRIGFRAATRCGLAAQAVAVAWPLLTEQPWALLASAAAVGAFAPAIVPLALGRIHTLVAPGSEAARAAWSYATTAFALGQAAAAYGMSFIYSRTEAYAPLFAVGCGALLLTLALDLLFSRGATRA